jgi:hypothetical protein
MRRLAAPLIGGLLISFLMELVVYPVVFYLAKSWQRGTLSAAPPPEIDDTQQQEADTPQ